METVKVILAGFIEGIRKIPLEFLFLSIFISIMTSYVAGWHIGLGVATLIALVSFWIIGYGFGAVEIIDLFSLTDEYEDMVQKSIALAIKSNKSTQKANDLAENAIKLLYDSQTVARDAVIAAEDRKDLASDVSRLEEKFSTLSKKTEKIKQHQYPVVRRRHRAIFNKVKPLVDDGMSNEQIAEWLQTMYSGSKKNQHYIVSARTVSRILDEFNK